MILGSVGYEYAKKEKNKVAQSCATTMELYYFELFWVELYYVFCKGPDSGSDDSGRGHTHQFRVERKHII